MFIKKLVEKIYFHIKEIFEKPAKIRRIFATRKIIDFRRPLKSGEDKIYNPISTME